MSQFLDTQNQLAAAKLKELGAPLRTQKFPALLELISVALQEDGTSITLPPGTAEPDPQQWERWAYLAERAPELALEALEHSMEWEDRPVPQNLADLPRWAADMVWFSLDHLDLVLD